MANSLDELPFLKRKVGTLDLLGLDDLTNEAAAASLASSSKLMVLERLQPCINIPGGGEQLSGLRGL